MTHTDPASELASEVAENRARVEETVDAIRHRLTPGQLIDEVLRSGREPAIEGLSNLRKTLVGNPVPTALIAAGVLWLLLAPRAEEQPPSKP